jgi:hypothetical protein
MITMETMVMTNGIDRSAAVGGALAGRANGTWLAG